MNGLSVGVRYSIAVRVFQRPQPVGPQHAHPDSVWMQPFEVAHPLLQGTEDMAMAHQGDRLHVGGSEVLAIGSLVKIFWMLQKASIA